MPTGEGRRLRGPTQVVNPCPPLRKKLKKANKAHNKAKVKKLRKKLRNLGCV